MTKEVADLCLEIHDCLKERVRELRSKVKDSEYQAQLRRIKSQAYIRILESEQNRYSIKLDNTRFY